MCGSNPELSPEVNSAKCIGGTALGFAIVTLIGFAIVPWGLVSALAGLFGVIAGSIVCCSDSPSTMRPLPQPQPPQPPLVPRHRVASFGRPPAMLQPVRWRK